MKLPNGFFDVVGRFLHEDGIRFASDSTGLDALRDAEDAREVVEGSLFQRIGADETFGFTDLMIEFSRSWTWLKNERVYYRNEGVAYGSSEPPGANPLTFTWTRLERFEGRQDFVYARYWETGVWEIFQSSLRHDTGDKAVAEAEAAYCLGSGMDTLEMEPIDFGEVIAELQRNRICWYPSAGLDTQDLLLTHEDHWGAESPQIFLHTDYDRWHRHSPLRSRMFEDKHTTIDLIDVKVVDFPETYKHQVSREFASFPDLAGKEPGGFRYLVRITSDKLGTSERVLYELNVENVDFLREVILRNSIKVQSLFHCCDGSAFGGAKVHFDFLYGLEDVLRIDRIISDHRVQTEICVPEAVRRALRFLIDLPEAVTLSGGWTRVPMEIERSGSPVKRGVYQRTVPIANRDGNGQGWLGFE